MLINRGKIVNKLLILVILQVLIFTMGTYAERCYPTFDQACEEFSSFNTCQQEFRDGEYMCGHFSRDFYKEAKEKGIKTWIFDYKAKYKKFEKWFWGPPEPGHGVNVIQIDYPYSDFLNKFCLIEPHGGSSYGCWIQPIDEEPNIPSWITEIMINLEPFADILADRADGWNYKWHNRTPQEKRNLLRPNPVAQPSPTPTTD